MRAHNSRSHVTTAITRDPGRPAGPHALDSRRPTRQCCADRDSSPAVTRMSFPALKLSIRLDCVAPAGDQERCPSTAEIHIPRDQSQPCAPRGIRPACPRASIGSAGPSPFPLAHQSLFARVPRASRCGACISRDASSCILQLAVILRPSPGQQSPAASERPWISIQVGDTPSDPGNRTKTRDILS